MTLLCQFPPAVFRPSFRLTRALSLVSPFPVSQVPQNPLGPGKCIRSAAALVIGDEILNGKTLDRNSNVFARYCFEYGIDLLVTLLAVYDRKRIEIIPDNEGEIIEASRRMVKNYDFVVTSGGIGPTHDDITYASLAKSFNQSLAHHAETLRRLEAMTRHRPWSSQQTSQQLEATRRMALFPDHAEVIFVGSDLWVPVVRLEGKLCIFPGIPSLFQKMLTALTPYLPLPPPHERPIRIQVFTERPESMIAPYLTSLQSRLKPRGVQIGSYPLLGKGVFVSLIGRDHLTSSPQLSSSLSSISATNSNPAPSAPSKAVNRYVTSAPGPSDLSSPSRPLAPSDPSPISASLLDIAQEVESEIGGCIVTEEEITRCKEGGPIPSVRNRPKLEKQRKR